MNKNKIPQFIKPYLWSYDINKIDIEKDKKLLVSAVLNWGDERSIKWLFKCYGKKKVIMISNSTPKGQWDKKSLNFWSLILNIKPKNRFANKI